jgi:two-component system phosphate regulon response regulator PhoB
MAKHKILVVDDEKDILELINYNLSSRGFEVSLAETGEKAIALAKTVKPDLIVLDLMLPGVDGIDVCRKLKEDQTTNTIPVIMLTAKGEESDIVTGLELGADDYITKPFSPKVLIARIRAVLRRNSEPSVNEKNLVKREGIVIDPQRYQVWIDQEPITLTLTEFQVLHLLAGKQGRVFTRYQIVDATKGDNYIVTDRAVDVQIVGLRKKLGKFGKYIQTVRGVGYKFEITEE